LMLFSRSVGSSFNDFIKIFIKVSTSSLGRFQFSVERHKELNFTPNLAQVLWWFYGFCSALMPESSNLVVLPIVHYRPLLWLNVGANYSCLYFLVSPFS
jgi:hypothetical protein